MTIRLLLVLLLLQLFPSIATADEHWHFPKLRSVYRDTFQISSRLRGTHLTTETLELMVSTSALSIAHELGVHRAALENGYESLVTKEREAELRELVLALIRESDIRWGPQPLWEAVVNGEPTSPEELPFYLIEQWKEDTIPWNAMNAAEIYLVGLQGDSERFVPPLVSTWEKLASAGRQHSQEAIMVANLLLNYALDTPWEFPRWRTSWYHTSFGYYSTEPVNYHMLNDRGRRAVLSIAEAWAPFESRYGVPGELEHAAIGNRRMAWGILELGEPLAIPQLRKIALARYPDNRDKRRAVYLWMLRDVDSLLHPANHDVFLSLTRTGLWQWDGLLYDLMAKQTDIPLNVPRFRRSLNEVFMTDVANRHQERLADIRSRHPRFVEILRDAVEKEPHPHTQIRQAALLLHSRDQDSREIIARVLVSNLADDDYLENANEAGFLLGRFGKESLDVIHAGLKVAVDMEDWQLLDRTAILLSTLDRDFKPGDFPQAMALMAKQLRDDDVPNNAAAARRYLEMCGDAARPYLEELLEGTDDQAKRLAEGILQSFDRVSPDGDPEK